MVILLEMDYGKFSWSNHHLSTTPEYNGTFVRINLQIDIFNGIPNRFEENKSGCMNEVLEIQR